MGKSNKEFKISGKTHHIYEGKCGMYVKEGAKSCGRKGKTLFFWRK